MEERQFFVFLPQNILRFNILCLFGFYELVGSCYHIGILFSIPCLSEKIPETLQKGLSSSFKQKCFGVIFKDSVLKGRPRKTFFNNYKADISFVLHFDENKNEFYFNYFAFRNQKIEEENTKIILYDDELFSSDLLPEAMNLEITNDRKPETFFHFLTQSLNSLQNDLVKVSPDMIFSFKKSNCSLSFVKNKLINLTNKFPSVPIHYKIRYAVVKIMKITSTGGQFCKRLSHLKAIMDSIQENNFVSLRCGNLISAIIMDVAWGILATILIRQYGELGQLLDIVMTHTSYFVNELQKLLYWLMGVPAGLKLNRPLNNALGHFFLYHIYLWKTYMAIIKPVFMFVMESFTLIGILGITFLLTLFNDLVSLATIHIYCFYGYAARSYGLQALGLSALWRLFWGKKWNPLRERVDSYTYDVHQLFVGTLMFTVLLFLLPTVMLYYVVFTVLRMIILTVQGIISKTVHVLNIMPVFVIFVRLIGSSCVKGDINFTVSSSQKNGLTVLFMKVIHIPFTSVIKLTIPRDDSGEQLLSWKSLVSSLIWGRIIYPL